MKKNNDRITVFTVCLSMFLVSALIGKAQASPDVLTITQTSEIDEQTGTVSVQGKVDADQSVSSITLNGLPTDEFDGESFRFTIPADTQYQFQVFGEAGDYQQINYSETDQVIDSAIQLVVADQLAQDVGPVLGRLLSDLDLASVLGINSDECVIDTILLRGCDLYIRELAIRGTPDIQVGFSPESPEALTINIDITIPEVAVQSELKRALWWGYRETTISTRDIDVGIQIGVKPTEDQSIQLILDDPSDINLTIGNISVQSNALTPHLIPLFKHAIARVIDRHAADVLGPFLAKLPIPAIPLELPIDLDNDEIADANFAINITPERLNVLSGGDGVAVLNGFIRSTIVAPGREVLGSLRIGGALPTADALIAPTDLRADLAVDLVNQVLTAVYQSGLEEQLTLPLTVGSLDLLGDALVNALGFSLDDELLARVRFGTSPFILLNNDSVNPLGLDAVFDQLTIELVAPREDGEELVLSFTSDIALDTSLGAEADGSLQLEFGNLLLVSNTVVNGGSLADLFEIIPGFLAGLLDVALPNLVGGLEPVIGDLLNAARLELDIGDVLGGFLEAEFPSVIAEGFITEAGVSDDEGYLQLGIGLDFE